MLRVDCSYSSGWGCRLQQQVLKIQHKDTSPTVTTKRYECMHALLRIDSSPGMDTCMKLPGWSEANTIESSSCCCGDSHMKKTPELYFHGLRESYQYSRALRQKTRLFWQSSSRSCYLAHLDLLLQPGWHKQVHTHPPTECT